MLRINNDGNENLLFEQIKIEVEIKCDVCGHTLKTRSSKNSVRVLPCANCVQHHAQSHAGRIEAAERHHQEELDARQAVRDEEKKKTEEAIYKKFEDRFKKLMKNPPEPSDLKTARQDI